MRTQGDDDSASGKNHLPMLKLFDSSLRLGAVPLSIAAIWITVTNQQNNSSYGMLKYNNLSGLKYMVFVSAICAGYALIAAACSWVRYLASKAWIFYISDQIAAYLMVTSVAATMEIYYLAYNGAKEDSWSEACSSYGRFCSKIVILLCLDFEDWLDSWLGVLACKVQVVWRLMSLAAGGQSLVDDYGCYVLYAGMAGLDAVY
ncbi:CASP-like protein 2D1, partial [Gastrolobium bilobum]|uniref:CASP-like protein 2D1 n=1 Tax=Gastrolobium bilobum TaxID=150636 RepID=UPI002AB1740B